jgi:hypothetical protein
MINMNVNLPSFMKAFSDVFKNIVFEGQYRLWPTGRFIHEQNYVSYGLGPKWWMRYADRDVDLIVHVSLGQYNGVAKISFCDGDLVTQYVCNLSHDAEEGINHPDILEYFRRKRESTQCDWLAAETHQDMLARFNESRSPKLVDVQSTVHDQENNTEEVDSEFSEQETNYSDFAISMQFKQQSEGCCLMVFLVTSRTRNDRYCISVKSPSMFLNHILLAYDRGYFGKFMLAVDKEHKSGARFSHLLSFRKMHRARTQAVCLSLPVSNEGVVDNRFRVGFVYDVLDRLTNMAGDEYLVLQVDSEGLERHSKHFVVFN